MDDKSPAFEELKDEAAPSFDWHHYYFAILDRLWIVVLLLVLGLVAAVFYLKNQEPLYSAQAVLFLDMESERLLKGVETVRDAQVRSLDMVNTVVDNLRSYPFALRVAEQLRLAGSKPFQNAIKAGGAEITKEQAAGSLMGIVKVRYRKGTRLIDIVATSRDPAMATELANGYANEYIHMKLEQSTESTRSAGQFLVEETQRLGGKLKLSEEALQSFRERERTASFETMLAEAQEQVKKIAAEIARDQDILEQIRRDVKAVEQDPGDEAGILLLPSIAANQQISVVTATIVQQEAELDLLSQRYLPGHPLFATAGKRLERSKQDRSKLLGRAVSLLAAQQAALEEQMKRLSEEKAAAEQRLLEITSKSLEYNGLTRGLEADRALYTAVVSRLKEVDVTKGMTDESIRIQELSMGPSPIPVPYVKILLMGLLGGTAAGVALALFLNSIDPTIRTVEQGERWTGLKVITAIPQIKIGTPGLITVHERQGFVAEAFRTLRTSIALVGGREQRQVFLFTSALPSEGKTFSSANFAATLAQQGFRTLYIDADLRKPAVSKLLFGENLLPGLTDVLTGSASIEQALRPGGTENLSVITAGSVSEHPSELIAGPALKGFFETVRKDYDRIVLDTAPVIAVSDTLLLLAHTDVNCLIVRANSTAKKSVQHAIRLLDELDCPPAGIVLNRMKSSRASGYYNYSYSGRAYGSGAYGPKAVYGQKGVYGQKKV